MLDLTTKKRVLAPLPDIPMGRSRDRVVALVVLVFVGPVIRRNYMRVRSRGLSLKTVFVMETAEDRLRHDSAAYGKQMAV
jgi:hypothetical protein